MENPRYCFTSSMYIMKMEVRISLYLICHGKYRMVRFVFDDIYDGERYDARLEKDGWDMPDYADKDWADACKVSEKMGRLVSQGTFPAVKVIKPRIPVSMTQPQAGVYLYDFGQNFAGGYI